MQKFFGLLSLLSVCSAQYLISPYTSFYNPYIGAPLAIPYTVPSLSIPKQLSVPVSVPVALPPSVSVPVATQYHSQDELGQFVFGHSSPLQTREESKTADGTVRGSYSYVDPNGKINHVVYKAGTEGFQILGANNLPVAPENNVEQVKDTAEVIAARADFTKKFEEVKAAAEKEPEVKSRRRRDVESKAEEKKEDSIILSTPQFLPYSILAKTVVKTSELKPVEDSKTPASTKLAEIKETEKEIATPYVLSNPLVSAYSLPYNPIYGFNSLPYSYGFNPLLSYISLVR